MVHNYNTRSKAPKGKGTKKKGPASATGVANGGGGGGGDRGCRGHDTTTIAVASDGVTASQLFQWFQNIATSTQVLADGAVKLAATSGMHETRLQVLETQQRTDVACFDTRLQKLENAFEELKKTKENKLNEEN